VRNACTYTHTHMYSAQQVMYCAYVCTHTEYMNYPQKVIYCAYACMCMYAACVCVFYTAGNVLCVTHYIGGSGRVGG